MLKEIVEEVIKLRYRMKGKRIDRDLSDGKREVLYVNT
jgi:hypothetical protein